MRRRGWKKEQLVNLSEYSHFEVIDFDRSRRRLKWGDKMLGLRKGLVDLELKLRDNNFNINLSESQIPGSLVFNASHGTGWSYSVDVLHSSRDAITNLHHQNSFSTSNRTRTYLTIHLHNKYCDVKSDRKENKNYMNGNSNEVEKYVYPRQNPWILSANLLTLCSEEENFDIPVKIILNIIPSNQNKFIEIRNNLHHRRFKRQLAFNQQPVFPQQSYTKEIQEEQNPGLHVITITATDADSGEAGTLTYSLEAAN
ncbi:hypothetical protein KUTeg_020780 [Tegillarca granosa]|uniref:Cadherin domain-containing protein n=1 Tax=Tegillarca granosa TaxID=220873 RepID=A0ABQ9E8X5_TEGGR|nr:hypothetical protein KUTeg_020780 [Tegillarca granosa]